MPWRIITNAVSVRSSLPYMAPQMMARIPSEGLIGMGKKLIRTPHSKDIVCHPLAVVATLVSQGMTLLRPTQERESALVDYNRKAAAIRQGCVIPRPIQASTSLQASMPAWAPLLPQTSKLTGLKLTETTQAPILATVCTLISSSIDLI